MKIYKYQIEIDPTIGNQVISVVLPKFARTLWVLADRNGLSPKGAAYINYYAEINPDDIVTKRNFMVLGTGAELTTENLNNYIYIGTVELPTSYGFYYIAHVYENYEDSV